jgi:ankyrin repeat protein
MKRVQDNITPLMCAAGRGYTDIAKMLIDNSGFVNATDRVRRCPIGE